MIASQLLRVLQTIPSDTVNKTCAGGLGEQDMTMKENQSAKIHNSERFRETDSLHSGSKEIYELKDSCWDNNPPSLEAKGRGESWNHKIMDEFAINDENGLIMDEFAINDENESVDSLSSDKSYMDKEQRIPEHRCLITTEDSQSPCSDLFQAELGCKLPELKVCYKATNHQVVKDICVDKIVVEHRKDGESKPIFPKPPDGRDNFKVEDGVELELFISGELEPTLLGYSWETDEANHLPASMDSSEDESLLDRDRDLPIQEFGTRSFLRSFLYTLDGEANNAAQLLDQVTNGKAAPERLAVVNEAVLQEDVRVHSLLDNTSMDIGSSAFNFEELNVVSGDVQDHTGNNAGNLANDRQVQCASSSRNPWMSGENANCENVHKQSLAQKDDKCSDHSTEQFQLPADKSRSPTRGNAQAVEPNASRRDWRKADNAFITDQLQYDEGESSFYAESFITYSGPLPFSGSLSNRSDGSATSGKSFAFPVLRSDWNSSPVRMAKDERKHFHKHKNWKSQFLCCKF